MLAYAVYDCRVYKGMIGGEFCQADKPFLLVYTKTKYERKSKMNQSRVFRSKEPLWGVSPAYNAYVVFMVRHDGWATLCCVVGAIPRYRWNRYFCAVPTFLLFSARILNRLLATVMYVKTNCLSVSRSFLPCDVFAERSV